MMSDLSNCVRNGRLLFFFFKQKTAYEMRISDWSSDVCSSDLVMSPSPIPKFDNPKMDRSPALQLFGAGREKRIYAVPPHTSVRSLDFDDHPFEIERWDRICAHCGSGASFLDEIVTDDLGGRMFVCSDQDHCAERRAGTSPGHARKGAGSWEEHTSEMQ